MTQTTQGGPFPQTPATEAVINLGLGQPSPSLLPMAEVAAAAAEQLAEAEPLLLQYGRGPGYDAFLEDLARFLTEEYGHPVQAEELAVTGGTSMALALVSQLLGGAGDRVLCGDPTYFLAHGIFATHRLNIEGVPVDEHGLDVDVLEKKLEEGPVAFVYCIPTFQNPRGVCLSAERARRLVALAEAHDFIIVADEPYNLLYFDERPTCLMAHDEGRGRVLSLGTFSKILGPGLRLGWVHAAPALRQRFLSHGSLRSGGCLNPLVARIVHGPLAGGMLTRHVASLREVLGRRARRLSDALEAAGMPHGRPRGGYFTWVDLGAGADTTVMLDRAQDEHGVGYCPGQRCAVDADLRRYLRLSFAFYDEDELASGVRRIRKAAGLQ